MMSQEMFMKIDDLRKEGWTITEIAEETGWHRSTISKYLAQGAPTRRVGVPVVMTARWEDRIEEMLERFPRLLAVSVYNRLRAEGFGGSYPTVVRAVRRIRGPRFRPAGVVSVLIHTDPGEEAQFDFCVLDEWAQRFGWSVSLVCFGMILSWSRFRVWWFTTSEDRHHTFEGMIRFFEAVGGVPGSCRTDRMGALGRSQGARFSLHPPTVEFAAHHRTVITSCRARDAKRKGKVERPFRQLRETFLPEVEADGVPGSIDELNQRASLWLTQRVNGVASRSTGARPVDRLVEERPFLTPLPVNRFDTDYVESRRVHDALPFISFAGNRYSVPPEALGSIVEVRRRVYGDHIEIRLGGRQVASHRIVDGHNLEVWDPAHRHHAEAIALGAGSPDLRVITSHNDRADEVGRLDLDGDYEVAEVDLVDRYPVLVEDDEGVSW